MAFQCNHPQVYLHLDGVLYNFAPYEVGPFRPSVTTTVIIRGEHGWLPWRPLWEHVLQACETRDCLSFQALKAS